MAIVETLIHAVRSACLRLPEVEERPSHSAPTFFVRGKQSFVSIWADGHHDDSFPHLWVAAQPGLQEDLVATRPEHFFRPPYVGHRGWVGVRMDCGVSESELEDLCEDAYRAVAPSTLTAQLDAADRNQA